MELKHIWNLKEEIKNLPESKKRKTFEVFGT